ncbi:MAG: addiction module toxin RelE [Candidatus Tectomicrobia bacterium]|uniref:Addiction module toxin RelE n=1 Tax=Tectimicrobiota bacterium TaxID=2528274 RepID=A0A932CM32_UNCTE|nr:addiction module toxin RelE [Candidatus Tectomicrobia bacterium]
MFPELRSLSSLDIPEKVTIIIVTMEALPPFTLIYAPITRTHLRAIAPKHYSLIRHTLTERLSYEPERPTRNRKPLKRPVMFEEAVATWELRFGPDNRFRAFYDVQLAERQVLILAIGVKIGNQLYIGREEVQL